jgi:hypothetical protein
MSVKDLMIVFISAGSIGTPRYLFMWVEIRVKVNQLSLERRELPDRVRWIRRARSHQLFGAEDGLLKQSHRQYGIFTISAPRAPNNSCLP